MEKQIDRIQSQIAKFIHERNWDKYHRPKNLAMSISIEAAELMELFQWISVSTSMERLQDEEFLEKVGDELADVLIYAFSLARVARLDIEQIITNKLDRNESRFPPDKNYYY